MLFDFEHSGVLLHKAKAAGNHVALEISSEKYEYMSDAINRAMTLAEVHLPSRFKTVDLYLSDRNISGPTISYTKLSSFEKSSSPKSIDSGLVSQSIKIQSPERIIKPTHRTDFLYPNITFGIGLAARVQVMDPDEPFRHQFYTKFSAHAKIAEGWDLWATYALDLWNNFNADRKPSSGLELVRSESVKYLTEGDSGIDSLYVERRASISDSLHYRAYFGILEYVLGYRWRDSL